MRRHRAIALAATLLLLAALVPGSARATTLYQWNSWRSGGFLYQDPSSTACTAAATMMMLNFTRLAGTGGNGFTWAVSRIHTSSDPAFIRDMSSVLAFERNHDTLATSGAGSDAHGWRNALNYYGWGVKAMTDPASRVYEDRAYTTFDGALKAAALAIARFHKPVGLLAWAGGHAQVATGYSVTGEDPRVSTNFVVNGFWMSDPLRSDGIVNQFISRSALLSGGLRYRFQWYRQIDSPYDDPYTAGTRPSSIQSTASEWYHRWVIVAPIRMGLPGRTVISR